MVTLGIRKNLAGALAGVLSRVGAEAPVPEGKRRVSDQGKAEWPHRDSQRVKRKEQRHMEDRLGELDMGEVGSCLGFGCNRESI